MWNIFFCDIIKIIKIKAQTLKNLSNFGSGIGPSFGVRPKL